MWWRNAKKQKQKTNNMQINEQLDLGTKEHGSYASIPQSNSRALLMQCDTEYYTERNK